MEYINFQWHTVRNEGLENLKLTRYITTSSVSVKQWMAYLMSFSKKLVVAGKRVRWQELLSAIKNIMESHHPLHFECTVHTGRSYN